MALYELHSAAVFSSSFFPFPRRSRFLPPDAQGLRLGAHTLQLVAEDGLGRVKASSTDKIWTTWGVSGGAQSFQLVEHPAPEDVEMTARFRVSGVENRLFLWRINGRSVCL